MPRVIHSSCSLRCYAGFGAGLLLRSAPFRRSSAMMRGFMPNRPSWRAGAFPAAMVVVLAAACDNAIPLNLPPPPCTSRYKVEPPARPVVVAVGGSRRLHVRLYDGDPELYSHCSRMSTEWFRWTISDPSVARVDRVDESSGAAVTITGLAVGRTSIRVQYGAVEGTRRISLEVRGSMQGES